MCGRLFLLHVCFFHRNLLCFFLLVCFWRKISKDILLKCCLPAPFSRKITIQSLTVLPTVTLWLYYMGPTMLAQLLCHSSLPCLSSIFHTTNSPHQTILLEMYFIVPHFLETTRSAKAVLHPYSHYTGAGSSPKKFNQVPLIFPGKISPFNFAS